MFPLDVTFLISGLKLIEVIEWKWIFIFIPLYLLSGISMALIIWDSMKFRINNCCKEALRSLVICLVFLFFTLLALQSDGNIHIYYSVIFIPVEVALVGLAVVLTK